MTTFVAYFGILVGYSSMILTNKSNDLTVSDLNTFDCCKQSFTNPNTPPSSLNTFEIAKSETHKSSIAKWLLLLREKTFYKFNITDFILGDPVVEIMINCI